MDVGQLQNPSCLTERRAPLYQINVRGIGGLKEGLTDGADTVTVKIIEARSSGLYLTRAGINVFFGNKVPTVLVLVYRE